VSTPASAATLRLSTVNASPATGLVWRTVNVSPSPVASATYRSCGKVAQSPVPVAHESLLDEADPVSFSFRHSVFPVGALYRPSAV